MTSRAFFLLAIILGSAPQAAGEPMCTPVLTVSKAKLSGMERGQRTWHARIAVDAARCATAAGRFQIRFIRLKEDAPDEGFREQFSWAPGEIEVSTLFAADEAVLEYAIEPLPCPCSRP
jgi:hypothetical protein